ncbi:acyl-CoA dehydrogenase [Paenibacillus sp. CAA11]|uniref:acyl-CoA dehydrogenase family protein n=1 Tax=Paenibacillus sp. CAA11 TaxID=1532905 RepID=UPI000D3C677D|nr:acyl-CoA dehydrogenase family protein [Paenibacillus sp. CAA11]AWB45801.1 acyl-CoA dehydrogenase [Paenibacillus sp. CAA11]
MEKRRDLTAGWLDAEYEHEVKRRAAAFEAEGKLPWDLLEHLYEKKLFKLFVPRTLGGLDADLPQALRVFQQAAAIDGSLGWLVTIGAGGGFFSGFLPPQQAADFFADREAVLAGSGMPTGTAQPVPGGYMVSGSWSYCSGSSFASFFTANCVIQGGKEEREILSFAFLPEQVEVVPDWNTLGMKATASHTIVVREAFVPKERTFDLSGAPILDSPIYRYPFEPFAIVSFTALCLGLGQGFLQEAEQLASAKQAAWSSAQPGRYAAIQAAVHSGRELLQTAAEAFYRLTDEAWERLSSGEQMQEAVAAEIGRVSREAVTAALDAADRVIRLLGMTALMLDQPVNRFWRDLHTAAQHGVFQPEFSL